MDIERILQTNIPDLTPVYGGIRGRTMSSSHQAYAWKAMKETGLKQVIDLRQDYKSDRYKETCEANGIAYYHYPVHKGKEFIANMLKEFTTFCELIDKGDFFISCAQGLHRTDIAFVHIGCFMAQTKRKSLQCLLAISKRKDMMQERYSMYSTPSTIFIQNKMALSQCRLSCSKREKM